MKMKQLLLLLLLSAMLPAQAQTSGSSLYDYPYLAFETTDGTVQTLAVESLVITITDDGLTATNADGSVTFSLSQLSKMYFSTSVATGLEETHSDDETVEVYTVSGVAVGKYENRLAARTALPKGLYVVKSRRSTRKMVIQ